MTPSRCADPSLDALLVSPAIREDPYPIYRRLRDEHPVFWSDQWRAWVISRYEDVVVSLKEKETLSNENRQGLLFAGLTEEERQKLAPLRHYFAQKDVIGSDGADHTRMRALVQKAFTPSMVSSLEGRIRQLARDLLAPAVRGGAFDLVADFAHPLPVILIAELLGAPPADRPHFKRWAADILGFQGTGATTFGPALVSQTALLEMFDYMSRLVEDRRAHPKGDVLTTLALAEEAGQGFSRDELLATCNTLLTAGHETTTNLIGNLIHLLLAEPARWEEVRGNPALTESAIEEALRYDAPKQRNFRRVKKAHVFAGVEFAPDEMVFQLIGAANRDERKFPDPDRYDLHRGRIEHLAFGSGIHFCLGAPLARLEARLALETLIEFKPDCRLLRPKVVWQERQQLRGPKELWLT